MLRRSYESLVADPPRMKSEDLTPFWMKKLNRDLGTTDVDKFFIDSCSRDRMIYVCMLMPEINKTVIIAGLITCILRRSRDCIRLFCRTIEGRGLVDIIHANLRHNKHPTHRFLSRLVKVSEVEPTDLCLEQEVIGYLSIEDEDDEEILRVIIGS